ncbi:protein kinase domain-containing protein [Blastococcus sp. SYSU D00813]
MQPGQGRIADRYELRSLLATGGMGQVWRASDTLLGRDVALKVLRSEFTGNPEFLARFRAEARHTAVLSHPNIATLFDYGEVPVGPGSPEHLAYLVMELVDGESLSQVLAREGRLDPDRTADVLRQTAAGLGAAHSLGVVHRDVKPGNVLVARDGTVKLTDFGIASSAASVPLTGTGQIIGTAHYISPEQAQGAPASPASDVYALGLVGYEMLAGRRAFDGENSVQVVMRHINEPPPPLPDDVPEPLRALVGRALAKDPAQRFPDGAAFRDAVDAARAGRPVAPLPGAFADGTPTAVIPPRPAGAAPPVTRVLPVAAPAAATSGPPSGPSQPARPAAQPPRRSRRGLLAGMVVLAALFAVGVVLALALGGGDDPGTGEAGTTTSAPADGTATSAAPETTVAEQPPTVGVAAGDYVGRPVGQVRAELTALGLQVQLRPVTTADAADGEVLALDPTGELEPGTVVTVTHAVAPPPPAAEEGDGNGGNGNGNGGNGNGGNGNGNDEEGGGNGDEGGGNGDEGGGNGNEGNQGNGGDD